MSRKLKYLNRKTVRIAAVIAMFGLLSSVTVSAVSSSRPSVTTASVATSEAQQPSFSDAELVQLVKQARGYHPPTPAHLHGRSAVTRQQTGPFISVGMAKSFPGLTRYSFKMSWIHTIFLKAFVNAHGSLAGLLASTAAATVCALIAIPVTIVGTPIASAIAAAILGPLCGAFIMLNWAQIDDALRNLTPSRACLGMNVYDVFGLGYVTTFDPKRCS